MSLSAPFEVNGLDYHLKSSLFEALCFQRLLGLNLKIWSIGKYIGKIYGSLYHSSDYCYSLTLHEPDQAENGEYMEILYIG